jgi:hypothetical protein
MEDDAVGTEARGLPTIAVSEDDLDAPDAP